MLKQVARLKHREWVSDEKPKTGRLHECMVDTRKRYKKQLRRLNKQKVSRGASLLKNCLIVMILISGNIGEKQNVNKK